MKPVNSLSIEGINIELRNSRKAKRLSLKSSNKGIYLSKPYFVSQRAAISFARDNTDWIKQHYIKPVIPKNNSRIGKNHRLIIKSSDKYKYSIEENIISVYLKNYDVEKGNNHILTACIEALRNETREYCLQRINFWQERMKLHPNSITIRNSTTRWGSCSAKGNLNFSLYLAQLPNHLIDYVLVHELAHLQHQNHQKLFWNLVTSQIPNSMDMRKQLRREKIVLNPW